MSDNRYYVKQKLAVAKQQAEAQGLRSEAGLRSRWEDLIRKSPDWREPEAKAGGRLLYILYFPKSSSFNPSSHLRNSSLVTRSDMFAASFEVFSTISSTKIGQSTRNANASASDGRESIEITSPPRSSQITA